MKKTELIDILENELKCVERAELCNCNRDCLNCELVKPAEIIKDTYKEVISLIKNLNNNQLEELGVDCSGLH